MVAAMHLWPPSMMASQAQRIASLISLFFEKSGQPAGRIWPAPTYIGGHPPYIGCVFIIFSSLWRLFSPEHVPKFQGRVFSDKKKAPARQPRVVVGMGFQQTSQIQRILTNIIPFSEKVREAK